jgi:hypothetical protein
MIMLSPQHPNPCKIGIDSPEFEAMLANNDDQVANEHLSTGHPIYYSDDRYPGGIVKEFPDGRLQLVSLNASGEICVIRDL